MERIGLSLSRTFLYKSFFHNFHNLHDLSSGSLGFQVFIELELIA